jgi:hypothetical protein
MKAIITYINGDKEVLEELTEIHYNYDSPLARTFGIQIAFESDILQTGCTKFMKDIKEIEIYNK